MKQIAEIVLGADTATLDFTSIPATYSDLLLVITGRLTVIDTNDLVRLRFNNDSGANYDGRMGYSSGTGSGSFGGFQEVAATAGVIGFLAGANAPADVADVIVVEIPSYARTTFQKATATRGTIKQSTASVYETRAAMFWRSTAAINQITVIPANGNFKTGTVATLYADEDGAEFVDVALRSTLSARSYRDIAARARITVRAFSNIAARARIIAPATRDIGSRFRLDFPLGNVMLRARLVVQGLSDVAFRARITARSFQDTAVRFRLSGSVAYANIALRARLFARAWANVSLRFTLATRTFRNVALRSRVAVRGFANVASRSYVRARSYREVRTRFRLVWIPWTPTHGFPPLADVISFLDDTSPVIVARMRSKRSKQSVTGQTQHFDNLDYPRVYFGEWREQTWDVTYRVVPGTDQDQFANLKALVSAGRTLKYVNQHGEVIVVAVMEVSVDFFMPIPTKPQDITLTLTRVQGVLP